MKGRRKMSTKIAANEQRGQIALVVMAIVGVLAPLGSFQMGNAFTRAADSGATAVCADPAPTLVARTEAPEPAGGFCGQL